jgi:hypothetical protein
MLDVWPALPLIVSCHGAYQIENDVDNIIAVLERSGHVCQIKIVNIQSLNLEIILAAMQQPFPELTDLSLQCRETVPVVPDSFLGGSAPRLRHLVLSNHFRDYRNYFCLPLTSSIFTFTIFPITDPIPDTSHPKRWSLPSPC